MDSTRPCAAALAAGKRHGAHLLQRRPRSRARLRAWQHGAFTKALLDAFGDPAADINHNGLISTTGLVRYVTNRVLALTDGRQHPGMEARFEATLFAVQR